jgi:hypothetical protein
MGLPTLKSLCLDLILKNISEIDDIQQLPLPNYVNENLRIYTTESQEITETIDRISRSLDTFRKLILHPNTDHSCALKSILLSLTTIHDDHTRIKNHNICHIDLKYQMMHLKIRYKELLANIIRKSTEAILAAIAGIALRLQEMQEFMESLN